MVYTLSALGAQHVLGVGYVKNIVVLFLLISPLWVSATTVYSYCVGMCEWWGHVPQGEPREGRNEHNLEQVQKC